MVRQWGLEIAHKLDISRKILNQHFHNAAFGKSNQQVGSKLAGFTLVELSIVLVIVGLLIGGILVGQSLIESTRTVKVISNFKQYEIAFTGFRQKFKQVPGDSDIFFTKGNNDGIMWSENSLESMYSVSHLQQAGFLNTNLVTSFSFATVPSNRVSGTVLENWGLKGAAAGFYDYRGYSIPKHYPDLVPTKPCTYSILYGRLPTPVYAYNPVGLTTSGVFTPQQAYSIDAKIDDGSIHTGGFLSYDGTLSPYEDSSYSGYPRCKSPPTAPSTDPTAKYNVKLDYKVCPVIYCMSDI